METRVTDVRLRVPEVDLALFDAAAASFGISRIQFIIDAAVERAEATLEEKRVEHAEERALASPNETSQST